MISSKHKREWYVPTQATEVSDTDSDAVVFTYIHTRATDGVDRLCAVGFHGRAQKPDFNISFRSIGRRETYIAEFFAGRQRSLAFKAKQQADRKATPRGLEVGDILRSSWGYDQTNIDFYQVTAVVGKRMVEIRPIGQEIREDGFMSGTCTPEPDAFIGSARRVAAVEGAVKVQSWGVWARKIGTEIQGVKTYGESRWSSYA